MKIITAIIPIAAAALALAVTPARAAEGAPLMLPPQTHEEVMDFFATLAGTSAVASEICPDAVFNAARLDEVAGAWGLTRPGDARRTAVMAGVAKFEALGAADKLGHAEWCAQNRKLGGALTPFVDWRRAP